MRRLCSGLFSRVELLMFTLALAFVVAAWFEPSVAAVVLAMPAAPAILRPTTAWGRKREPMKTFQNVGANQTFYSMVPRYPRTILGMILQKGGTTFTDAQLTRIEVFAGEKSIWGPVSATDLRMVERYINGSTASGVDSGSDPYFLTIDFTFPNVKEIAGEQIGGLDLGSIPPGVQVRVEGDIAGATAPTLTGHFVWSPPQGQNDLAGLMRKLIKRTYPAQAAGDFYPQVDVRGSILCRQYFKGIVYNNAVVTAHTAANAGTVNTGDGAASATVASLTPAGRYHAVCIEPAANAGKFAIFDPKGNFDGTYTVGAGALAMPSGLTPTIADGAADFIAGDGFFFDVLPNNTDGNINLIEVKKNEDFFFYRTSRANRYEAQKYGRTPMAGLEVADYLMDNHGDSIIDTANASALDYRLNLTAADTVAVIHETLARPFEGS